MIRNCLWCDEEFEAKTLGAHRKRFCTPRCKNRFNSALRRWGRRALAAGDLSVADLKAGRASCTTRGRVLKRDA